MTSTLPATRDTHTKRQTHKTVETSQMYPNLAHDFTESATCCHFQNPSGKKHTHHDGRCAEMLPVRDRSAQTSRGETTSSTTGLFCKTKLMPELTWSGVQSLTPEIICSLISSRCHVCPLLSTFNDIVSIDYRDTALSFPVLLWQRRHINRLIEME